MAVSSSVIVGAASGRPDCPFPGLHSYDLDHQAFFRGREQETMELAQRILASRLTVLTAGSGDGKTSLIHAGIAPLLLAEGYEVAVAEPGGQEPVRAVAGPALERLLPIGAGNPVLLDWLRDQVPGETLRDKRRLLLEERATGIRKSPWIVERALDVFKGGPIWTWLINERCGDDVVNGAMEAIAGSLADRGKPLAWPGLDAPLDEVREFFLAARCELDRPWMKLDDQPMEILDSVLEDFARSIEQRCKKPGFELVLFVDQLEEIFVQFRGGPMSRRREAQPWRHRQALLELLVEIKEAEDWPIRLVLSLRKEHYADLQAAFADQELLAANTYHLAPMRKEQAYASLVQLKPIANPEADPDAAATLLGPAEAGWETFLDQALSALVAEREGKWVDPTELSSFGRWLWHKPLPDDAAEAVGFALLGQVRKVLDFGPENPVITSTARRQEALDVLSSLIIASEGGTGRRISLPEQALWARPGRNAELRSEILAHLARSRLLRLERKDGHGYYEIVHERTIAIIETLAQQWHDPLLVDFARTYEALRDRCLSAPFAVPALARYEVNVLAANLERLDLSDYFASRLLDALLADREWAGNLTDEGHAAHTHLVRHLRHGAHADIKAIRPEEAMAQAAQAIARDELASPALATMVPLPLEGPRARPTARWLIASSLVCTEATPQLLAAWAEALQVRSDP